MKLALLGYDDHALELARWAIERGGHELVAAYDVANRASDVLAIAPRASNGEAWENLLLGSQAEGVIVGRNLAGLSGQTGIADPERRADQLRKLVQAAIPMIVVVPACEAIVGFELEMIRRDTRCVMLPSFPDAQHPVLASLANALADDETSSIGKLEQAILERELMDRTRENILAQLARDVAILRPFLDPIRSVTASGAANTLGRDPLGPKPKEPPSLANLSVQLVGADGLVARWSVVPAHGAKQGRLTLIGSRGKAVLNMSQGGHWSREIHGDQPATQTFDQETSPERLFWQLSHAASGDEFYDDSAWLNACRDQETSEAADRSLARGKTIELFNEAHTEESSFKGVMAAGGCLVLTFALLAVFLAALVDGLQMPLRNWTVWRLWPVYLLVPVAFFLALQLLQLALKRDGKATERG